MPVRTAPTQKKRNFRGIRVAKRTLPQVRTQKLDLRLTPFAKRTLQQAALVSCRSVSQFVLESAMQRADEALADRRAFALNKEQWQAFLAALDAPPRPLPRLQQLLKDPGFFEASPAR